MLVYFSQFIKNMQIFSNIKKANASLTGKSISVDESLKSVFQVNASGVDCPIHGTHTFSYSHGHGLCSYPLYFLDQCSDKSYQACVDIKGSQSQTGQAHCIADWKEGSTYYTLQQKDTERCN
jgi:hypothetical protein